MRAEFLPFSKPSISEEDIQAVADVLRSGWITTGRHATAFEEEFAASIGARAAVAVATATALPRPCRRKRPWTPYRAATPHWRRRTPSSAASARSAAANPVVNAAKATAGANALHVAKAASARHAATMPQHRKFLTLPIPRLLIPFRTSISRQTKA